MGALIQAVFEAVWTQTQHDRGARRGIGYDSAGNLRGGGWEGHEGVLRFGTMQKPGVCKGV